MATSVRGAAFMVDGLFGESGCCAGRNQATDSNGWWT